MLYLKHISLLHRYSSLPGGCGFMDKKEEKQPLAYEDLPEDVTDCMQCLITLYGETHIDTLAQLLNLTAYAEAKFSHHHVQHHS